MAEGFAEAGVSGPQECDDGDEARLILLAVRESAAVEAKGPAGPEGQPAVGEAAGNASNASKAAGIAFNTVPPPHSFPKMPAAPTDPTASTTPKAPSAPAASTTPKVPSAPATPKASKPPQRPSAPNRAPKAAAATKAAEFAGNRGSGVVAGTGGKESKAGALLQAAYTGTAASIRKATSTGLADTGEAGAAMPIVSHSKGTVFSVKGASLVNWFNSH